MDRSTGLLPVGLEHPDQLAEVVGRLDRLRREEGEDAAEPFDVAAELEPGGDPAPFAAAGATWVSSRSRRIRYRSTRYAA